MKPSSFIATERQTLPLVPLRDMVIFPNMMAPFIVGRESSVRALEQALTGNGKRIFLVAQKDPKVDEPEREDIYDIGVVATVVQNLKLPNGNVKVMVEGVVRGRLLEMFEIDGAMNAEVEVLEASFPTSDELTSYMAKVLAAFEQYAKMSHHLAFEGLMSTLKLDDPDRFADVLSAHLMVATPEKQSLLERINPYERLQRLHDLLDVEIEKINIDKRINVKVKKQMEKAQKEYYLNEKIKAIHQELGRKDDRGDEIAELRQKIEEVGLPEAAKEKAEQELKRLEAMPPVSAEATVSRNYIDWLLSVPWKKKTREQKDLKRAEEILDADHYGLEKIKERILEFLAVRQLVGQTKSSIICFVGPPGVGKSSLAKSIARATGRKFVRLSLGGVRDEAEIRGHRRTYIGAFPGQIVQMMKKAGTVNPVFLLDEIDKMSMDFRGDPSAALLEVLDPEQNDSFLDHYLDVDYDLSKVMFIATANVGHTIPPALKDRMELISLSGYTPNEKQAIAKQFLVPKQLEAHGLSADKVRFTDEGLKLLIERYTREAGVRNLEREVGSVCRKIARRVVQEKGAVEVEVGPEVVGELLGKPKYRPRKKNEESEIGVATGLAWTEVGGELLETEVGLMRGKGKLTLTGQLGDVMQESARAAVSYLRSRADLLGVDPDFNETNDLHLHVPEGAIPKDGPSAGITMATALVSALTQVPVRKDVAMTGEITLRGKVLPVGGIKDKVLAAYRAGITELILPQENEKDLEEIPEEIRAVLEVHLIDSMDEVLRLALDGPIAPLPRPEGKLEGTTSEPPVGGDSLAH
ncbi:MAG TPA: endopeptidase La [Thermoanaerobaculia bacterium]|nr:endopeptidase La [Thermoanaerobaculia bacterium]